MSQQKTVESRVLSVLKDCPRARFDDMILIMHYYNRYGNYLRAGELEIKSLSEILGHANTTITLFFHFVSPPSIDNFIKTMCCGLLLVRTTPCHTYFVQSQPKKKKADRISKEKLSALSIRL